MKPDDELLPFEDWPGGYWKAMPIYTPISTALFAGLEALMPIFATPPTAPGMEEAMTWTAFKALIDAQLKEKGISEETAIWYIDISWPSAEHESKTPEVFVDEHSGLAIH